MSQRKMGMSGDSSLADLSLPISIGIGTMTVRFREKKEMAPVRTSIWQLPLQNSREYHSGAQADAMRAGFFERPLYSAPNYYKATFDR